MKPQFRVIAHRGASTAAPENTLAAFALARELGADWVELDVRRCADGWLAVRHDPVLAAERHELPGDVPSLEDALRACTGMGVNVEIKNSPREPGFDPEARMVPPVVAAIRGWGGPVLVSSFHPPTVARVRAEAPELPTALLTYVLVDLPTTVEACAAAGHAALNPYDATVDEGLVAACREAGLQVNVWTVDDPVRIAELAAMGVDGIVTNVPDVAVAVRQRRS